MSSKSPKNGFLQHQERYKFSTPPWKDVYRKRCLQRLHNGRRKLLEKFRQMDKSESLVKEVMEEEWNMLRKDTDLCLTPEYKRYNLFCYEPEFGDDEDLNDLINVFEEIQNELIEEEKLLLSQEYEKDLIFEEERLCAAIESLQTNDLICPICKQNPLLQNKQVIFCSCGLQFYTENDAITLDWVHSQLMDAMEQHRNYGCMDQALFSVTSHPELQVKNLIMACKSCDFLAIIL
ncbi:RPA-interacting protein B-like [Xenia sp. Carnegie-2017]|uniref:RPA-interacting protein B-like n=1 Tax=Xenia sp. Carnegie-2017 TaxID=2897299 RepID=UPI001F04FF66|nr:RPA-interacting protein B-like [Xenia sp. Carnegie-2017]